MEAGGHRKGALRKALVDLKNAWQDRNSINRIEALVLTANISAWKALLAAAILGGGIGGASAQVPAVLLEACNNLQPAAKRTACLRAAQQGGNRGAPANITGKTYGTADVPSTYVPPPQQAAEVYPVTPVLPMQPQGGYPQPGYPPSGYPASGISQGGYPASGGATCHVGPRGGTYTITRSGKKNYGGC